MTDDPFPVDQAATPAPYPALDRHRVFAERYVVDFDRVAAMLAAGYTGDGLGARAAQLLLQPAVAVYVEHLLRRQAAEAEHTAAEVMAELWRNHRAAQSSGDLKTSNAALIAYGKHLGMFAEKHQHLHAHASLEQLVAASMRIQQAPAPEPDTEVVVIHPAPEREQ